jgi:hypothetical protein
MDSHDCTSQLVMNLKLGSGKLQAAHYLNRMAAKRFNSPQTDDTDDSRPYHNDVVVSLQRSQKR